MMRDDDSYEEEVARPPAYNEQRFETKIEADLGYEIEDAVLREEIAEEVYNPKIVAEFGYDPEVGGADGPSQPAMLATQAAYAGNTGAFDESEGSEQEGGGQPTNLLASSKGYVMPKNLGENEAAEEEDLEKKFGFGPQDGDSDEEGADAGHKPYEALDAVREEDDEEEEEVKPKKGSRKVGKQDNKIKVAVRLRPLNKFEKTSKKTKDPEKLLGWKVEDDGDVDVLLQKGVRTKVEGKSMFHVDRVYEENDTIDALYDDICEPILTAVMSGQHGTIFAYGSTGGGKSHTIQGGKGTNGVIQMAVRDLFFRIAEDNTREYTVHASYFEIYNEQVRDLMIEEEAADQKSRRATAVITTVNKTNHDLPILNIHEDPKTGDVAVDGQTTTVSTVENVTRVLHKGNRNRATEKTDTNKFSSRSHAIFRLTVESHERLKEGDVPETIPLRRSTFNFVDLAGSENSSKAGTSGRSKREGGKINQSLLALSLVITQLSLPKKKQPPFINYRDSKLTRILQPHLSGNAAMAIVCCASPYKKEVEATRQTLKFAQNAKRVKLKPTVNEIVDEKVLIENLKKELHDARLRIQELEQYIEENPPGSGGGGGGGGGFGGGGTSSSFPVIEAFMAKMNESVNTADFLDALEELSSHSGGGLAASTRDTNDTADDGEAAAEEDEDDIDAFRRQILAKFMMEAEDATESQTAEDNVDTTMNDTTMNDTTTDGGATTDYDTSVNRTYTDDTMETRETNDASKREQNVDDVFRSAPTVESEKHPLPLLESAPPATSAEPSSRERKNLVAEDSSGIPYEPSEADLNLIEKFRKEILEKFRDEIVDEEAAHELDENAQNVAVIANELINKFKKEIVYKYKNDFPELLVKRVTSGGIGQVMEQGVPAGQSTDDSSGADNSGDNSGDGSVERFEDEFEEDMEDDGEEHRASRPPPKRAYSTQTDGAVINAKAGTGGMASSRAETDQSGPPINSLGRGTSGSVSSDLSSDVADRDRGSGLSPMAAAPPGDSADGLILPGEIDVGKGPAEPASLDSKMRIKFLEEKLAATEELVETLFVELENAKTFIRELVFESAGGNGIDQSAGAALFGAGSSGVNVVDEQILNQCEILKFAIYTSLLFFVFGQHELFLATVFFLWLSLEVATKT